MAKKINIFGILLCISVVSLQAQMFYYFQGQRIELTVDRTVVNVIVNENIARSSRANQLFQQFGIEQDDSSPVQGIMKLNFGFEPSEQAYSELVEALKQIEEVKHVFPFFERRGADPIGTSDIFYIRLRETEDTVLLREVAERHGVQIIRQIPYMPLWYILSLQGSGFSNSIEATNYFFETGLFAAIDPAFMFNFTPSSDPICDGPWTLWEQWALRNTTSARDVGINACRAWSITRGAGVNVAVVDVEIDRTHIALRNNFHTLSFDTRRAGRAPITPDLPHHGTNSAGIIAAVRSTLPFGNLTYNFIGVAPEARIMRVSNELMPHRYISAELASGISWAWRNGADVINNSWGDDGGYFYSYMRSEVLEDAIIEAIRLGRQGRGAVVVFASGNRSLGTIGIIDYPASFHPDILVVGAIYMNTLRRHNSGFGSQ